MLQLAINMGRLEKDSKKGGKFLPKTFTPIYTTITLMNLNPWWLNLLRTNTESNLLTKHTRNKAWIPTGSSPKNPLAAVKMSNPVAGSNPVDRRGRKESNVRTQPGNMTLNSLYTRKSEPGCLSTRLGNNLTLFKISKTARSPTQALQLYYVFLIIACSMPRGNTTWTLSHHPHQPSI